MEKGRKDAVLLTVIGIATLLVAIVGATFAFFTARISNTDNSSTLTIKSASGGSATFVGGDLIQVENIYPRGTDHSNPWVEKTIRITYTNANSTYDYKYTLALVYTNTFGTNQLKYKLEALTGYCSVGNATSEAACEGTEPDTTGYTWTAATSGGTITTQNDYVPVGADTITLGEGTLAHSSGVTSYTHVYKLSISYPDTRQNQNYTGQVSGRTNQEQRATFYVTAVESSNAQS